MCLFKGFARVLGKSWKQRFCKSFYVKITDSKGGVSAGAALGATLMIVLGGDLFSQNSLGIFFIPLAAVAGSSLVIFMLYFMTKGFGYEGVTYMLLVGIAINAIAGVGIGILTYISSDAELRSLTFWTMGSFGGGYLAIIGTRHTNYYFFNYGNDSICKTIRSSSIRRT